MATPRIFVSSTCYDLQEIRFHLRNFIKEFAYEPVMSEFDDIFYSYEAHVQDACIDEISKCQLFILVVGNNYGSFYHQNEHQDKIPDSVTLKEFKKALEIKIFKHIFINKYVDYDYKNYKRALEKAILKYFQETNVSDNKIEQTKLQIKIDFDEKYYFAYDSYKYIFYFLDIIYDLKENNAVSSFETFADIKENLRKQWAGFMFESLTKRDKISAALIQPLETKIDHIEKNISKLFENKTIDQNSKVTFDLSSLTRESNIENLEKLQDKIYKLLQHICNYEGITEFGEPYAGKRVVFNKKWNKDLTGSWLTYLHEILQSYKWSKMIDVEIIFKGYPIDKYNRYNKEIEYKILFELYTIYNSLEVEDQKNLINTITQRLNNNYEKPPPPKQEIEGEDLPF